MLLLANRKTASGKAFTPLCHGFVFWCSTSADSLQALSFALCHVYARSTRSVSIPAPVYCKCHSCRSSFYRLHQRSTHSLDADIVCTRAKNHFDPNDMINILGSEEDSIDTSKQQDHLAKYQKGFKALHAKQKTLMYFSVSYFGVLKSLLLADRRRQ